MIDDRAAVAANRRSWEERARLHQETQLPALLARFASPDASALDPHLADTLREVGVAGRRVLHVCCNNGRELVSVRRLGSGPCVGVDLSESNVAQARRLAAAAGCAGDVAFHARDASQLGDDLGRFGLVLVTVGSLGWFPRLPPLLEGIARALEPDGRLVIQEAHPIVDMFDPQDAPTLKHDYFRTEPFVEAGPDYFDRDRQLTIPWQWFHHTLADVLGACLGAGLALERFEEHGHDLSLQLDRVDWRGARPPLSFLLVARRTAR